MPAMTTNVGERPRDSVVSSHQQDAVRPRTHCALRAGAVEVGGVADAVPTGEDVALFPLEHCRVDVRLARQHAR